MGSLSFLQGNLPNPGIKPRSPALQADSLPVEPPWKHKNTGVSSLSLLQQIFPTQGLNPGLLHYRWILYQLSYQGSPILHTYRPFPFIIYICVCVCQYILHTHTFYMYITQTYLESLHTYTHVFHVHIDPFVHYIHTYMSSTYM